MAAVETSNPYGTLNNSAPVSNNTTNNHITGEDAENQPLLGRKPDAQSWWRRNMVVDIDRDWADVVLLLCYIITGMLDGASISTFQCFVSMQTGNTVYLGLGPTAGTNRWKKSGVSILCFCLGSFMFSRLHRYFSPSPKRRWVLCLSFSIQTILIAVAASIVTWGPTPVDNQDVNWYVLIPIALVAFQSCGQAVASRALKYNALTSVVLTSIYCDLFSDAELFAGISSNVERNRRFAAPVLCLCGAMLGGFLATSSIGTSGALWTATILKAIVVFVWFSWPTEKK